MSNEEVLKLIEDGRIIPIQIKANDEETSKYNLKNLEALNMIINVLENDTNFKDELKTLVAKRLDEINHFISGCDSPFTYLQIREVQELMCDIRTTLGIEVEE